MSRVVYPAVARWRAADDGDEHRFCSTCAFSQACLAHGMNKAALRDLHLLVEHVGPIKPGQHVFRAGDPFEAIAAVREGTVKLARDREGREQVLGFHLPGEIIGLSAIDNERYPCNAVALDTAQLCRFSFPRIAVLATRVPGLQKELYRLLSRDIVHAERLAGDYAADTRLAMPRTVIANYLRLAPETVSRLLGRFQDGDLIRARGRNLEKRDRPGLERIAAPLLGN